MSLRRHASWIMNHAALIDGSLSAEVIVHLLLPTQTSMRPGILPCLSLPYLT